MHSHWKKTGHNNRSKIHVTIKSISLGNLKLMKESNISKLRSNYWLFSVLQQNEIWVDFLPFFFDGKILFKMGKQFQIVAAKPLFLVMLFIDS